MITDPLFKLTPGVMVLLLVAMMFCHVFDDYVLQGCLANLKQKSW